jgi:hypothetical protein
MLAVAKGGLARDGTDANQSPSLSDHLADALQTQQRPG